MGNQPLSKTSEKWLMGGAIAVAVLVGAWGVTQVMQSQAQDGPAISPAPIPTAPQAIAALGRIEPAGGVIKVGGPSGQRIAKLLVKEGEQVKAGQALAHLENYAERIAERDLAASQLAEAQALLASERQLGKAQVLEARTRQAQVDAPKTREMAAQEATIERLRKELTREEKELERFQFLRKEGAVAQQLLDDRRLAQQSKQEDLNNAIATLAKLEQEQRTDRDNATAQLRSAEASMVRSEVQARLQSAQSNLALAQARLDRTIIRAPQAGQVLDLVLKEGEAIAPITGQGTGGEQSILELGNTHQMHVVAEVYETDIPRVRLQQSATITSPVFESELKGTVDQIGLKIGKNDVLDTDPAADTDTRVVEVKIRLQDSQPVAGLTNLQVNVKIYPGAKNS